MSCCFPLRGGLRLFRDEVDFMSDYEVSTLKKGLLILDLLREGKILTLTEIAEAQNLNKTTAFRMLSTLENMEYIVKKGKHFALNNDKFQLNTSSQSPDWTLMQTPYQLGMSEAEGIYVGVLENTEVVMKQVIKFPFREPDHSEIGERSPSYISALGKVILANLEPEERDKVVASLPFNQATDNTFADQDMFFQHLEVIKKQGFALDDEERFEGVRCIAVPVYHNNLVVAAVAIAGPIDKMKKKIIRGLTKQVILVSKEMTKELDIRY